MAVDLVVSPIPVLVLPTEQRRQHLANVVLHKLQLQSGFLLSDVSLYRKQLVILEVTLEQSTTKIEILTVLCSFPPLKLLGAPECKSAAGDPALLAEQGDDVLGNEV